MAKKNNKNTVEETAPVRKNQIAVNIDTLLPNVIDFKVNEYQIGDVLFKTFALYNYPPTVTMGWLRNMVGYSNVIVQYHVESVSANDIIDSIDRTITSERTKQYESTHDTDRDDSEITINKARDLARQLRSEGAKAFNLVTSITAFSKDPDDLRHICDDIKKQLDGLIFTIRPMSYFQKEGFVQNFPVCDDAYKYLAGIEMTTSTFAGSFGFLPPMGLNDPEGGYIGRDLSYEPIFFDPWSRKNGRNNSNMVITGTSGSGKSTTAKNLLFNEFANGTTIIAIDAEKEMVGICKSLRGNAIETSGSSDSKINPLQLRTLPEAWDELSSDELKRFIRNGRENKKDFQGPLSLHISFLKQWFAMYFEDASTAELSALESVLYILYKVFGIDEYSDPREMEQAFFPIISELFIALKALVNVDDQNKALSELVNLGWEKRGFDLRIPMEKCSKQEQFVRRVIQTLVAYCLKVPRAQADKIEIYNSLISRLDSAVNGADRFMFNGVTTINMNNQFTVFDVHSLLTMKENVKNAQFFNITSYCWLKMTKNRRERVILAVDEAHLFISKKHNQVFEWMSTSSRRFRKYEAALWIMTQNINDFLHESVKEYGQPLLNNPDLKFIMRQRSTDLETLRTLFNITENESAMIGNATRGEGLLMAGNIHLFTNIEVPPQLLKLIESTGGGR